MSKEKENISLEKAKKLLLDNPDLLLELQMEKETKKRLDELKSKTTTDFILNFGQQRIQDGLVEFLKTDGRNIFLIQGYAGTGKTFLATAFINYVLRNRLVKNIALTAPTNKAVKVLLRQSSFDPDLVSFKTVHSLLGIIEQIDDNGKTYYKSKDQFLCEIENYDVVIIDEASMLNFDLFSQIMEYHHKIKFIFLGDPAQIPPVKENYSPVFQAPVWQQYNFIIDELSNIIRQKEGSPIIKMATDLRKNLLYPGRVTDHNIYKNTDDEGIFFLKFSNKEEKQVINDMIRKFFCSKDFKADSDYVKILCWTNSMVNGFNNSVRKMIYGENPGQLEIGEKLIANMPILQGRDIIFTTNDEFEVVDYISKERKIERYNFRYFYVTVKYYDVYEKQVLKKNVRIIKDGDRIDFMKACDDKQEQAKMRPKGSKERKIKFREYYDFKRFFADTSYAYALTCHKSQGSTYDHCIVYEDDIDENPNILERNRIKYTAFTRPRKNLYVLTNR